MVGKKECGGESRFPCLDSDREALEAAVTTAHEDPDHAEISEVD